MKISIVTITYGDGARLDRAVHSVYSQRLPEGVGLEHVIVDSDPGCDTSPATAAAKARGSKIIKTPPSGVYAAINRGLAETCGDIVGFVHGSDYLAADDVLAAVADKFAGGDIDFVYGDIRYVSGIANIRETGRYISKGFRPEYLRYGFAPPHPSLFVSRRVLDSMGPYSEDYRIGSDFDYFVRLFDPARGYLGTHLGRITTDMDDSGISRTLYARVFTNTKEKYLALCRNGVRTSLAALMRRYLLHFKTFRQ